MKYLSVAETAKLARLALKESFPGVKFSVRSKSYSGGASINISYSDGPKSEDVKDVIGVFEGAYFDGMIDYKGAVYGELNGEAVRFGADFIFVNRDCSDQMVQKAIDMIVEYSPGNFMVNGEIVKPVVSEFRKGNYYNTFPYGGSFAGCNSPNALQSMIYIKMSELDNGFKRKASSFLQKVKRTGSDGYTYSQTAMAIGAAPGRGM